MRCVPSERWRTCGGRGSDEGNAAAESANNKNAPPHHKAPPRLTVRARQRPSIRSIIRPLGTVRPRRPAPCRPRQDAGDGGRAYERARGPAGQHGYGESKAWRSIEDVDGCEAKNAVVIESSACDEGNRVRIGPANQDDVRGEGLGGRERTGMPAPLSEGLDGRKGKGNGSARPRSEGTVQQTIEHAGGDHAAQAQRDAATAPATDQVAGERFAKSTMRNSREQASQCFFEPAVRHFFRPGSHARGRTRTGSACRCLQGALRDSHTTRERDGDGNDESMENRLRSTRMSARNVDARADRLGQVKEVACALGNRIARQIFAHAGMTPTRLWP